MHNGFDFDYERLARLKELHTLGAFFNSFSGVNKRIPANMPEYENLSFYQIVILSPRLEIMLSRDYTTKLTMMVAIENNNRCIND